MKELIEIQNDLIVLKDQSKIEIKFKYRTCEQIFQEVKPLCKKHGVLLTVSDEPVLIGERYYIKATARVEKDGKFVEATAYAREPDKLMSMSYPQITGSCSSYARKGAMGGLFNIDDNQDPDGEDGSGDQGDDKKTHFKPMTVQQKGVMKDFLVVLDKKGSEATNKAGLAICECLGHEKVSFEDAAGLIRRVQKTLSIEEKKNV